MFKGTKLSCCELEFVMLRDLGVRLFIPFIHFVYRCFMSWLTIVLFRIGRTRASNVLVLEIAAVAAFHRNGAAGRLAAMRCTCKWTGWRRVCNWESGAGDEMHGLLPVGAWAEWLMRWITGSNPGSSRPNTGSRESNRGGASPVSAPLPQVVDPWPVPHPIFFWKNENGRV
jgi:hypothetical protein